MNFLFTLDKNYIEPLKMCLLSILRFPSKDGWNVYIITKNTEDFNDFAGNMERLKEGLKIYLIEADDSIFKGFPETVRYSKVVYYRIFASEFLPKNMDRVLYLDPDIIVINSLEELYNTDLDGYYYAACSHTKTLLNDVNRIRLGMKKNTPYINSGVMLMNLDELRRNQTIKEVFDYVKKYGKHFILPDQDIISALYGDKINLLDTLKYNISDRIIKMNNLNPKNEYIDINWVWENSVIIHYYGENKPWKDDYNGILGRFYEDIAKLAKEKNIFEN